MHIVLTPIAGTEALHLRIEAVRLVINDKVYACDDLPPAGPIRIESGVAVIEYGDRGGVNTCQLTDLHSVEVIAATLPPPPPPPVDIEAEAQAALEAQRDGWRVARWQIKTALGRDRWQVIEDFGTAKDAPWGLQTVIEDATDIPRNSQTVELLAYILGMDDTAVDAVFQTAMQLKA